MTRALLSALLVVVLAAVAGAAALAFSNAQPKTYAADVKLSFGRLVSPELQLLGAGFSPPQVDENVEIQTEGAEVASFDVARATAAAAPDLGLTPGAVSGDVTVTPVRDTLTVTLVARESTPERAARLANVYAQQYLKIRRQREANRAKQAQTVLKRRLSQLRRPDKRGVRGAGLRDQINTLAIMRRLGSGSPQVIEAARAGGSPASPDTLRNVLFGVLFGLVVGIGLVALRIETSRRAGASSARAPVRSGGNGAPPGR